MNGHMDTQLGRVSIDPEVIATYAGSVAVECFGIVGMAGCCQYERWSGEVTEKRLFDTWY